jgi:uncharacterized protein YndB with AHSA1/START domain
MSTHEQDLGRFTRQGDEATLRFTRRLPQSPETVWRALTEPEHLEAWFPTTIEGERRAGAPLTFTHRDAVVPPMEGEMVAYEPLRLMELRWGPDLVRFEIEPDGEGTLLRFTNVFDEIGKAARDAAGWHACLDLLVAEAAGESPAFTSSDRWREVHPGYVERLGAEASAIGPPEEWERVYGSA